MNPAPDTKVVREQYDTAADLYDRRWSYYTYATVTAALDAMECRGAERVLDVACGTGELTRLLLAQCPQIRVTGVDLSLKMLAVAHRKLAHAPAVTFANAAIPPLPFANDAFDLVVSTNSFHYFPDPAGACREVARVLRPGGRCLIVDWCHDYWTCKLCQWYLRLTDPAHHRMYTLAECQALLKAAGLQPRRAERFKISALWGLMTVAAVKRQNAQPAPAPSLVA